ncbi:NAD(P)-dependent alcohol dehydrogenase [Sandaracinus amylolyticus]|uniref:Zinc-containing alcohol dehydrogenase n=1 Tax=Sandaracinus amylolyticus TaxID=927083 RepID=A0A0F6VZH6_9BACT|nr:NAD(P)-dependent alcohol dehydrogenase [Sandaracinus amylolyticus]AKF03452.1 zinc-containing alcohol dehydrogenase [Sandaracinus amylolyticus]
MRAAVHHRFGPPDVLSIQDLPPPRPRAREVLVRVEAAALNPKDVLIRKGRYRVLSGAHFPMGSGFDVAGVIEAVGPRVHDRSVGERVFGMLDGFRGRTCAELVTLRADQCAPAPEGLSFVEAAALPLAASTALQALRDVAQIRRGDRVLLHGASGGVGVHAIQIAKALGAHVTTTSGAHNLERCASLGADVTLTYDDPGEPFTQGTRYDAIVDVYGNRSFAWARRGLTPRGTYVSTVPSRTLFLDVARTALASPKARLVIVRSRARDLDTIASMARADALRPVIDRVLPLESIADGHAHLETRHARGKVVLTIRR